MAGLSLAQGKFKSRPGPLGTCGRSHVRRSTASCECSSSSTTTGRGSYAPAGKTCSRLRAFAPKLGVGLCQVVVLLPPGHQQLVTWSWLSLPWQASC